MANKHSLSNQPSTVLQQKFNDVCFRLGQEIGNERRSVYNQEQLKDQQEELEKAFMIAVQREQEAAQRKANNEKNNTDAKAATEQAKEALEPKGD